MVSLCFPLEILKGEHGTDYVFQIQSRQLNAACAVRKGEQFPVRIGLQFGKKVAEFYNDYFIVEKLDICFIKVSFLDKGTAKLGEHRVDITDGDGKASADYLLSPAEDLSVTLDLCVYSS